MKAWTIFSGKSEPHNGLKDLPDAPPWRLGGSSKPLGDPPESSNLNAERARALPFRPDPEMVTAVNAALYLRKPLLIRGQPGTGKSSLISKVAYELRMGAVLRWNISSRSTVRDGIYLYDAVGRLQAGGNIDPPVEQYLTLGPLGTSLTSTDWPRALLIDEIDKSDLDFANDLLNVIEDGQFEIPELRRLGKSKVRVLDCEGTPVDISRGRLVASQFPFVIMTSNGEREFPPALLRRCIQLSVKPPSSTALAEIVESHLSSLFDAGRRSRVQSLIDDFVVQRQSGDIATDQLLNAVFLCLSTNGSTERDLSEREFKALQEMLWQQLGDSNT